MKNNDILDNKNLQVYKKNKNDKNNNYRNNNNDENN